MYPEYVCFSPTNWRHITVAYNNEINLWHLEQFNQDRVKITSTRFILPPTDTNTIETVVGSDFKDEFNYPNSTITNLDEDFSTTIDEILDKRRRHVFKSMCWSSIDEILISTLENYIFKVT